MPIRIQCPLCDKQYQAPDHLAGKKMKCRRCGQEILIDAGTTTQPAGDDGEIDAQANEAERARQLAGKRNYQPRLQRGPAPLRGTSTGRGPRAVAALSMPEFGAPSTAGEAEFELDSINRTKWIFILFLPLAILAVAPAAFFGMPYLGVTAAALFFPFVLAVVMMVSERLYVAREAGGRFSATAVTRFLGMPFRTEEIDLSRYNEIYIDHAHTRNAGIIFIAVVRFLVILMCMGVLFAMFDRSQSGSDELDENFSASFIGPNQMALVICIDNRFTKVREVAEKASRLTGFPIKSGLPEGTATRFDISLPR